MRNMAILYGQVRSTVFQFQACLNQSRVGPRELCIVRKSAIPAIYGSQSECLKSTWYGQVSKDCKKCSIHMTRDFDDHKRRRRAWDRGFSIKGIHTQEHTSGMYWSMLTPHRSS